MTRLILMRHGQTDFTLQRRYCGFNDPLLNDEGISQAEILADRFKDIKPDKVYSSDLKRTSMTAEIVFKNSPVERLANFREMNFGIFEGLKYEDITKSYPELYMDWIDNPLKLTIPDGENLRDLDKRVKEGLSLILSLNKNGTIALVSHGGPIRIILLEAMGLDLEKLWQIKQDPTAVNIIEYEDTGKSKVITVNDTSHLSASKEEVL